jgi:glycosyltransferase involved in cell wall biosynthesis
VLFDHSIFVEQKQGGITRYLAQLVRHLPEFGVVPKIVAPLYVSVRLPDIAAGIVWGRLMRSPTTNGKRLGKALGRLLVGPLARRFRAEIVHESYHSPVRTAPKSAKVVITVYDMTHEVFPDLFVPKGRVIQWKTASVERADWIICISENTRQDLLRFHPHVADRVSVVHLGFDPPAPLPAVSERPHKRPYFLYVGMRRDYKNFMGLVDAFAASERLRRDFDVVCIGDGAFQPGERDALAKAGVAGNFLQFEADDPALQRWYRHAGLFAYPSLYEGFGIPPLEAMAADCPVVAMNASSIPEVCGDAAEYALPGEPESLRAALEHVAYSTERAESLRALGRERIKLFSWEKCARETCEIYRKLL